MSNRYAIRYELSDGTLLEPYSYLNTKAMALRVARDLAKGTNPEDVVRIWVDDTVEDVGVRAYGVRR